MFKVGYIELFFMLIKLFNVILINGCFFDIWRINMLSFLYKKGDNICFEKYCGIVVFSNVFKFLCGI